MTISNTNAPVTRYSGNGATTAFATVFVFNLSSELVVTLTDSSGINTVQTITTHYTVSGGNNSTGTVTFLTAPASGYTVTLERVTPLTQAVDYVENDSFPAETHEGALDKLTRIVQEMDYTNRRALLYPATAGIIDLVLPTPDAGYFLRWNTTEDGLENATVADTGSYVFDVGVGILAQTSALASTVRTLTGTANQILITNGTGETGNPTIGFDSTIRMSDSALEVVDDMDATKKLKFQCSGITTATTRTLTVPNASGTIALTSDFADSTFRVYDNSDTSKLLAFELSGITTATTRTLTVPNSSGTIALTSDIPVVAAQSDQETGTSTTTFVAPGRQQYHPSAAKGWVSYTHVTGTPTIYSSYNVTSLTDNGAGDVSINFTTNFSNANYTVITASCANAASTMITRVGAQTTSVCSVITQNSISPFTKNDIDSATSVTGLAFFGDQ